MCRDDLWIIAYEICEELSRMYCSSLRWTDWGGRCGVGEEEVIEILAKHEDDLRRALSRGR